MADKDITAISKWLNEFVEGRNIGFTVFVIPFDTDKPRCDYASNMTKTDLTKILWGILEELEK